MVAIGREDIMSALRTIGVGEQGAWSIASSLLLMRMDPELSLWEEASDIHLRDFVAECQDAGPFSAGLFEIIERLCKFVAVLIDFYGPDDYRAEKLGSGMNRLTCAAYGAI